MQAIDTDQLERAVPDLEPTKQKTKVPPALRLSNTAKEFAETTRRRYLPVEKAPKKADARAWAEGQDWEPGSIGPFYEEHEDGDYWVWIGARRRAVEESGIGGPL